MAPPKTKEVVLGVTGSVACYKACDIIRLLKRDGFAVTPVMTREAGEFITPLALQAVSNNRVFGEMFVRQTEWDPLHVSLAKRADLVLIAPATANIIGKLACGICDDLLTCIACSTDAPILIAPAMNSRMYKNRIVQENISKLKRTGCGFVGPIKGALTCGDIDIGHLAQVETIVREAKKILKANVRT